MNDTVNFREDVKIPEIILSAVKIAGILALAAVAPNTVQLLRFLPKTKSRTCYFPAYIDQTVKRLIKRGLIKIERVNGLPVVRLTNKGEDELSRYTLREKVLKQKEWDGKWRILIFDIKEYRRTTRDLLRKELIDLGFVRLQNSVWINPYECGEVSVLLKADLRIGKDLLYMTVEKLENDKWLKKCFALR
jgi:DNA-binding transcriptional regulator PaaX